jgi:hypothetical protein
MRKEGKLTNLDYETDEAKRIAVHDHSASIANHLCCAAPENCNREKPSPPSEALIQVNDEVDAEECDEDGICGERGLVLID